MTIPVVDVSQCMSQTSLLYGMSIEGDGYPGKIKDSTHILFSQIIVKTPFISVDQGITEKQD